MEEYFRKGMIERCPNGSNCAFQWNDSELLSSAAMKALSTQDRPELARCVKIDWNGVPRLVYLTGEYRRLDQMLQTMQAEEFLQIMMEFIQTALKLRESSILGCNNIVVSSESIFWDQKSRRVKLIYLPLASAYSRTDMEFDNYLRRTLSGWIDRYFPGSRAVLSEFASALNNYSLDLRELFAGGGKKTDSTGTRAIAEELQLVPLDGSGNPIAVRGSEYVIGRSKLADGCIPGNPRIGRKHCKILKQDGKFYVMDLESRNGTYLNHTQIKPHSAYALSEGMILSLADASYAVHIRTGRQA